MQNVRLSKEFYTQSAIELAPNLLGKFLCRKLQDGSVIRKRITECECYMGEDDTGCHASRGKTPRNAPMYEGGGITYIYLCYGMHHLINIVAGRVGYPEAVLLRGLEGISGPGRLTKRLDINLSLNKVNLIDSDEIWLEDGEQLPFITTPRIGIDYAQEKDRLLLWRFLAIL